MTELGSNIDPVKTAPAKVRKPRAKPEGLAAMPETKTVKVEPRIKIMLDDSELIPPSGLFIGVNGFGYQLQTGVEMSIPMSVKEVLDNAVIGVPDVDPQTRQVVGWRQRPRYSYRVINT